MKYQHKKVIKSVQIGQFNIELLHFHDLDSDGKVSQWMQTWQVAINDTIDGYPIVQKEGKHYKTQEVEKYWEVVHCYYRGDDKFEEAEELFKKEVTRLTLATSLVIPTVEIETNDGSWHSHLDDDCCDQLNIKKEEGTFTFVKPIHMAPFIDWSWQIHEFCLPTEFSIIRPQFLVPNKGRLYGTFLSYEDGKFYDARSIPQTDHALSHLHSPNVSAVECFKDYGDDGHTDMRLSGFFLLLGGRHDRLYKKIPAKK